MEVIDYLPRYVMNKKSIWKELRKARGGGLKPKAYVKGAAYAAHVRELRARDRAFDSFIAEHLRLTEPCPDHRSLVLHVPDADLYLCGSDQIWNPTLTGGRFDGAFFLRFTKKLRAAYGASIGELDLREHTDSLRRLTEGLAGISVREASAAGALEEILGREVKVVLDPTLLLDRADYAGMESEGRRHHLPYLLLYNIQNSEISSEIAGRIAKEEGLDIVDLSPNPFVKPKGADKQIGIGPAEFLSYVRDAECVVTNSFHGTVFSIIYGKPFLSVPHKTRGGRTRDLLDLLGFSDRLVESAAEASMKGINGEEVRERLLKAREESFDYLKGILGAV